jgi:hypothetical protein
MGFSYRNERNKLIHSYEYRNSEHTLMEKSHEEQEEMVN